MVSIAYELNHHASFDIKDDHRLFFLPPFFQQLSRYSVSVCPLYLQMYFISSNISVFYNSSVYLWSTSIQASFHYINYTHLYTFLIARLYHSLFPCLIMKGIKSSSFPLFLLVRNTLLQFIVCLLVSLVPYGFCRRFVGSYFNQLCVEVSKWQKEGCLVILAPLMTSF